MNNRKLVKGLLLFLLVFTLISGYYSAYGSVVIDTSPYNYATQVSTQSKLVKDSRGFLYAVYIDWYDGDPHVFMASSKDNGITWVNVTWVSEGLGGSQTNPSIAIGNDNIHIVWNGYRAWGGGGTQVGYRRYMPATDTWSAIIEVSNEASKAHTHPVLVTSAGGARVFFQSNHRGVGSWDIYSKFVAINYVVGAWTLHSENLVGELFSASNHEYPTVAKSRSGAYRWVLMWIGDSNVTGERSIFMETNHDSDQQRVTSDVYADYLSSVTLDNNLGVHLAFQSTNGGSIVNHQIHYVKVDYYSMNIIDYAYISNETGKFYNLYLNHNPNIAIDNFNRPYIAWDGENIDRTPSDVTFYRWMDLMTGWQNITEIYVDGISANPNLLYEVMGDEVELIFWEDFGADEVRYEDFNVSDQANYPEVLNVTLYNSDGSLNDGWLFKGEIYDLECYVVYTSYIEFNFTDGINKVRFRYYNQSYLDSIAIRNNGSMEFVMSTVYSDYEVYPDNTTRLLWRFILEDNIVDSVNVEWNYLIANYISNITLSFTNIFQVNIYNLGSNVYYEYSGGGTGHIVGGHPYEIYATNGTSLEWAKAYVLKRRWQHFHSLFSWDLGDHECADHDELSGYIQFGTQIRLDGTYQSSYRVNLYIIDGAVDPFPTSNGKVYVKIKVEWMNYNSSGAFVVRKTDYISAYYDGGDQKENRTTIRLWVDMWFSDLNSSTIVAGRVNSYYYGMVEKSTYLIWTGWKPFIAEDEVSTFYDDFRDNTGQIISSTDVELVRHWGLIQKLPDGGTGEAGDEDCDTHTWSLTQFREYHQKVADDRMMGIGNPPYEDTKIISMPQSSFVATLYRAIESMGRLVWLGAFNFLKILWGSIDTFATWLGIDTSIFSYIFEYIGTLPNIIISMMSYLAAILQYIPDSISRMFSVILATIGGYLFMIGMIVDTFLSFWRELTSLFTGGWMGVRNMWDELSIVQWIQLALIGWVPFWWLDRINKSKDGFGTAVKDVRLFLNSIVAVFYLIRDVLIFVGNLISKIWEILPI